MSINMDQQQHSPTSPVLIGGKTSTGTTATGAAGNAFANGRQSLSSRDGLLVLPNRPASVAGGRECKTIAILINYFFLYQFVH
jgi:hypothetical protein